MSVLHHPTIPDVSVTVPESEAESWQASGWVEDQSADAPDRVERPRRTRKPTPKTPAGDDG